MDQLEGRLYVSAKVARHAMGDMGNNRFYELVNTGEIESFLDGAKRVVSVRSIKARMERLAKTGTKKLPAPPEPHGRKQRREAAAQAA